MREGDLVSIDFYGKTADGKAIMLGHEHPAAINMASGNGRAFLEFLGVDPGPEPCGEITMPEARRAVMRAKATFERKVDHFTRSGSDTKRPGHVRVIEGGIGPDYFERRLADFERFLNVVAEKGATSIYWA
jgi:hypothetical protein